MTNHDDFELRVMAHLDGVLDADASDALQREIADDAEKRAVFDEHTRVQALVAAHRQELGVPLTIERRLAGRIPVLATMEPRLQSPDAPIGATLTTAATRRLHHLAWYGLASILVLVLLWISLPSTLVDPAPEAAISATPSTNSAAATPAAPASTTAPDHAAVPALQRIPDTAPSATSDAGIRRSAAHDAGHALHRSDAAAPAVSDHVPPATPPDRSTPPQSTQAEISPVLWNNAPTLFVLSADGFVVAPLVPFTTEAAHDAAWRDHVPPMPGPRLLPPLLIVATAGAVAPMRTGAAADQLHGSFLVGIHYPLTDRIELGIEGGQSALRLRQAVYTGVITTSEGIPVLTETAGHADNTATFIRLRASWLLTPGSLTFAQAFVSGGWAFGEASTPLFSVGATLGRHLSSNIRLLLLAQYQGGWARSTAPAPLPGEKGVPVGIIGTLPTTRTYTSGVDVRFGIGYFLW